VETFFRVVQLLTACN